MKWTKWFTKVTYLNPFRFSLRQSWPIPLEIERYYVTKCIIINKTKNYNRSKKKVCVELKSTLTSGEWPLLRDKVILLPLLCGIYFPSVKLEYGKHHHIGQNSISIKLGAIVLIMENHDILCDSPTVMILLPILYSRKFLLG